ncbi:RagB/SusD family nutrient uptake outer membrane protein [Persicobacter psychrovividus]|uniref:Membrane protein n=1 Tax=Persicobacter psychrovividus TaxID=387638 RepID=A0ABN6LFR7_9BACT|nr:membrane protein [Persicobacter psychrovividus]
MKKVIKLLIIVALGFGATSCSNFLDKKMEGVYNSDTFFKTQAHAEAALAGAYNSLLYNNSANALWVFGDIASDDAVKGGLPGDQADIEFIEKHQVLPNNGYVELYWKHCYEGIARANNVIARTPAVKMDDTDKAQIIAQAKFLRAYQYFNLARVYGAVPLKLQPADNPEEVHTPLSAIDKVYAQIEQDLMEAKDELPESWPGAQLGKVTKGAASALLARTFLYEKKWQQAYDEAAAVEGMGYQLEQVYGDNFKVSHDNNQESIFEVQQVAGMNPMMGNILNQWFAPRDENGYGFNTPTKNFVDEFEQTPDGVADPRLDYTLGRDGQKWFDGVDFDPSWSATGFVGKKFLQPLSEIPKGTKQDADLDVKLIRLDEVILIKAEAANELGKIAEAATELNKLRKRAREAYLFDENLPNHGAVPSNLLPDVVASSQEQMREAIRHERRVELGMESQRYFDLMRYGKDYAEKALGENQFNFEKDRYMPIPQSERDFNNNI